MEKTETERDGDRTRDGGRWGSNERETIKVMNYNSFCLFREIICLVLLGFTENLL